MNEKCTRCDNEITDFRIDISFSIKVDRIKEDSIREYIPNLDQTSREILCNDCFQKFSKLMAGMNIKYEG